MNGAIAPDERASAHETVSFALFLEYRRQRLHAPVVETPEDLPDAPAPPPHPPASVRKAVEKEGGRRVVPHFGRQHSRH